MADRESYEAMLEFIEDVFFEYRPDENKIEIFNTDSSRLTAGAMEWNEFTAMLMGMTGEDDHPAISTLKSHIEGLEPVFTVKLQENLWLEEGSISGTLIQGRRVESDPANRFIIGRIHPLHVRGTSRKLTYDALTGLVSKMDIEALAKKRIDYQHRDNTTIAIVDIDFFKNANDTYGHSFGDEVLRTVASIMKETIGEDGVAGRIGGDEFMVVFNNLNEEELREVLHSMKVRVNKAFPIQGPGGDKPISLSIGTAVYPADAGIYDDIFLIADHCLYMAKQKGRNRFVIYTHGKHPSLEEIKGLGSRRAGIVNGRSDLPLGDVLVQMLFMIKYGNRPKISELLSEFAERFGIPLLMLYREEDSRLLESVGSQSRETDRVNAVREMLLDPGIRKRLDRGMELSICNNVSHIPVEYRHIEEGIAPSDIRSFMLCPFTDAKGSAMVLILVSLHDNLIWNSQHFPYYRLFVDALSTYEF